MFDSEVHRLDWLIRQIEERLKGRRIAPPATELLNAFVVTSLWLDAVLAQAKAILLLSTQGLSAAIGPLQRSLWELWIEWRYFLKSGDRAENAAKVMLNAEIEALEFLDKHPGVLSVDMLRRLQRHTTEFELEHPEASAAIREQRKKRKFHWSGISRAAMELTLAPDAAVYQILSWDAHAVMGPIRDVSIDLKDGVATFEFGRKEDESDINRYAWASGGVLFYVYNDFASLWGLPPIVLPKVQNANLK